MKTFPTWVIPGLLLSVAGEAPAAATPDTPASRLARETAPQLYAYTENVLFGDAWKRPDLSPRDRSLVTMASLLANGQAAQMTSHIKLALDNGLKPGEITAVITHMAFYAGWPNAMSAVGVADQVFKERGIKAAELRPKPSEALPLDKAAEARRATNVKESIAPIAPELARYTSDVLLADLWRRADLTPRDRSLVTVAALIARGQLDQLPSDLNRAMDNGLTQAQATEAVTHLAFYAGWPRAMSALPVLKSVFAERR